MAEYRKSRSGPAQSNVYTVLVLIALLVLAVGVGYVWYRSATLFGTKNPFQVSYRPTPSLVSLA